MKSLGEDSELAPLDRALAALAEVVGDVGVDAVVVAAAAAGAEPVVVELLP
jgi:hypothetical protein